MHISWVKFFLPKVNGHFLFFLPCFFFTIIAWDQRYFGLLINKKAGGRHSRPLCSAYGASQWLLVAF